MSKRLHVVLDEGEWAEIEAIARRHGQTASEWARAALRAAVRRQPTRSAERKLAALRAAVQHEGPTTDIDLINAEIASGYPTELPEPTRVRS